MLPMNRIHLSQKAQNDLLEIKAYIEEELMNPSAAITTVSKITRSLHVLYDHAQGGHYCLRLRMSKAITGLL